VIRSLCFAVNDVSSINCHRPSSDDLPARGASEKAGEESERLGFGCPAKPVDREFAEIVLGNDAFVSVAAKKETNSRIRQDRTVLGCEVTVRFSMCLHPFVLLVPKGQSPLVRRGDYNRQNGRGGLYRLDQIVCRILCKQSESIYGASLKRAHILRYAAGSETSFENILMTWLLSALSVCGEVSGKRTD
jgi:hypothetical protein